MLKVRFAEVDRNKAQQLGINIFSLGAANTIGSITTQQFNPPSITNTNTAGNVINPTATFSDLLNIFVYRPDINLGATLKALETKNVLQILAEPNLMARSGEPAKFIAGGEFPYPIVNGGGAGGLLAVTIQFRPYGVKLDFTGTINSDNTVRLKVAPEVSTLDYANSLTFQGFVVPAISTRRAETDIDLKDGQSFGIAGLMDNRTTVQMSKIPGIGDIPILGALFKSRNVTRSNTELLVIVTPVIVDPVSSPATAPEGPKGPFEQLDPKKFDDSVGGKKPASATESQKQ